MKSKTYIFVCFWLGVATGASLWNASMTGLRQKKMENAYLIASMQSLVKQTPKDRQEYLAKNPIFNNLTQYSQYSNDNELYYWFTMTPESTMENSALNKFGHGVNFSGFYIVLTKSGIITDFGYHKP